MIVSCKIYLQNENICCCDCCWGIIDINHNNSSFLQKFSFYNIFIENNARNSNWARGRCHPRPNFRVGVPDPSFLSGSRSSFAKLAKVTFMWSWTHCYESSFLGWKSIILANYFYNYQQYVIGIVGLALIDRCLKISITHVNQYHGICKEPETYWFVWKLTLNLEKLLSYPISNFGLKSLSSIIDHWLN